MSLPDARALKDSGMSLFQRGEHTQALSQFASAAELFAAAGDELGRAEMLNNMGVIYRLKREPEAAISAFQEAEEVFDRLGEQSLKAQVLGNLGDVFAAGRDKNQAAVCYGEAAAFFAASGDRIKQSQVLRALSLMRLRQGRWLEAMMRMEESLSVLPRPGLFRWLFRGLLRFAIGLIAGNP